MAPAVIRILSDLHFRDRASRLGSLAALAPLFDGVSQLVLNGDTLDTRPGEHPADTAATHTEVAQFFGHQTPPATLLTGNHDPDISPQHSADFAAGQVFVTHGDILFDDIVPWSRDAATAHQLVSAERAKLPAASREHLDGQLAAHRRAAAAIPQRHQAERHGLKYALGYAADTVWPPQRIFRVLRTWRETPHRAAALVQRHRPAAKFFVLGHVHHPGVWRHPSGLVVLNTGAFCSPVAAAAIDLLPHRLILRRVERRRGEFWPGPVLAEFALADSGPPVTLAP